MAISAAFPARRSAAVAGLAALVLALAACTGTNSVPGAGTTPAQGAGGGVKDATVTVGEIDEPPSWNIFAQSGTRSGNSQWGNIFEPLVVYDYTTREYKGILAESWEMTDEVWTFHLREGVSFSDGTPFTAEDVIFTFDRIASHPDSLQVSNVRGITDMEAVDDHTLAITLEEVSVSFLSLVNGTMIMSKEAFDGAGEDEAMRAMVGTGPYTLSSWTQGSELILERNGSYWGEAPAVKTLILRTIPDDSARLAALTAGEIDLMRELPMQNVANVESTPGIKVFQNDGVRILMFPFNPTIEPYGDIRVRKAISLAIDTKSIIDSILGGTMVPMRGPLPSTVAGHNPDWPEPEYDPDAAKTLVEEIGGGSPVKISFTAPGGSYPGDREIAQAVVQMLTNVGFEVELLSPDFSVISENLDAGKMGFYMISKGNYTDAGAVLQQYYQTGVTLRTMYENPEVNDLLSRQATEQDEATRTAVIMQAADLIREDYASVWLGTYNNIWAGADHIEWTPGAHERIQGKDIAVLQE